VRGFDVGAHNRQVFVDHLKRLVAENALESEDVSPIAQVFDGEGVPELVRMSMNVSTIAPRLISSKIYSLGYYSKTLIK